MPPALIVIEAPLTILISRATGKPFTITGKIVGPMGITTSLEDVGTPPHQFKGLSQSVLTPSQVEKAVGFTVMTALPVRLAEPAVQNASLNAVRV